MNATWLTGKRARAYGLIVWVTGVVLTVGLYAHILAPALSDPLGRAAPTDFDAFWAGAWLALHGHPEAAYDAHAVQTAELLVTQNQAGAWFPYLYPPVFLLLTLPLALLPYLAALPAFLLAGYATLVACLRCILPARWSWLPILLAPATMMDAVVGQNGYLSASCFAGALLLLDNRPAAAGICLGLLAGKPHLAVCAPVVLIAARRGRALAACAVTAGALTAISWSVFGGATWAAFFAASSMMGTMLQSPLVWPKLVSVYGAARVLQAGVPLAFVLQAASGVAAVACLARIAVSRPGGGAEIAALVPAALLCTPFLWDYDLVCLGVPSAWIAARAERTGWLAGEKLLLCALYVLPVLARAANLRLGLPVTPPLAACLLLLVARRARHAAPALRDPALGDAALGDAALGDAALGVAA